jgi:hypothetical protein
MNPGRKRLLETTVGVEDAVVLGSDGPEGGVEARLSRLRLSQFCTTYRPLLGNK